MTAAAGPISPAREKVVKLAVWGSLSIVLAAVVAAGVLNLLRGSGGGRSASGPQATYAPGADYGIVPDFTLVERSGRSVSRRDLAGRFWIADFIFTRCTGACPILSARMASLARELSGIPGAADLRFVSFTVDPGWDTPEVLARYAAGLGRVDERWLFLTGPPGDLYRLIGTGFRLSVAEREPSDPGAGDLITHSDRFVLVDPAGRIRGYYHGDDEESVRTLAGDLERLRREPAR